jgi:hypothetical protein
VLLRDSIKIRSIIVWLFLFAGLALTATTQTSPSDSQSHEPSKTGQAGSKISAAQSEELFRSVDDIVKFASQDSGLPIRQPVKRRMVDRAEVERYVQERMREDKDAQRLQRSAIVLKKFGLLPHDFDLKDFLLKTLKEQVAGYYDPKTKTVNLLDWLAPDIQKPVLAHELTHALQDQSYDLEKWERPGGDDQPVSSAKSDVSADEAEAARQAVVEGQAMVVLLNYELAPQKQTLLDMPTITDAVKSGMAASSPLLSNAPLYLKSALLFPYFYGLDFERVLLQKGGKELAFSKALKDPPRDTREIMQPQAYLTNDHVKPLAVPDLNKLVGNDYEQIDDGVMGEFDVSVLIEQFAGKEASDTLSPGWRGGYYYAARKKGAPEDSVSLLYLSRWSTAHQAAKFAGVYAGSITKRYQKAAAVSHNTSSPTEWNTEEGKVFIERYGNDALIIEGFETAVADKLRHAIEPFPTHTP